MFFGTKLMARAVAFLIEELQDAAAQRLQQIVANGALEQDETLLVELLSFLRGHQRR
jgi:hypothetical protein